ncbi:MAG: acyl carrier protein [Candidatus Fimisoma sp.]
MKFEEVKEIMVDTLGCDETKISMEAVLADDLKIDSLDAVELVMAIEEKYGIKIPDEELSNMKTVADVVSAIEKYKA